MAASCPGGLPSPPANLHQRKLPLKLVTGSAFRIHRIVDGCFYFGKGDSERFNDPARQFGVLYAALQPEAAFAEVFLRRLSLILIQELDLQKRVVTEIAFAQLRCVDLTASGLRKVSCDNRIATEKPYQTVGQWSQCFYTHPQQPDGIIYRSRQNPLFKCLALFDRCQSRLVQGRTQQLMAEHRRAWTIEQVNKYALALEPAP